MTIQLSKSSETWLLQEVAAGRFASLDEAVEVALEQLRIAADDVADEDLLTHKSSIDEAVAQLDRGEGILSDDVFAGLRDRIAQAD